MIAKKLNDAFNKQINEEMFSAHLYLSMAAYFDSQNLPGFSFWFKLQAREEMFHAMRFYNHLVERGGVVELFALKDPQKKWQSAQKVFENALHHEEFITGCINKLMDLSLAENDHASRSLLTWFVDEQVEEEASVSEVLDKLKMVAGQAHMLYMLDKEMATRTPGIDPYVGAPQAE